LNFRHAAELTPIATAPLLGLPFGLYCVHQMETQPGAFLTSRPFQGYR
jgi:hypothetical protein